MVGGDSITGSTLSAGVLQGHASVAEIISLPLHVLRARVLGRAPSALEASVDWAAEATLPWPAASPAEAEAPVPLERGCVLVTGVTGFLGPHLLQAISQAGCWRTVVALVRAPVDRVAVAMPPGVNLKLMRFDLAALGLGLSPEDRQYLDSTPVDTVVHSAAIVNHVRSYMQMKSANVSSCEELVRLTAKWRPNVVFVSSISSARPGSSEEQPLRVACAPCGMSFMPAVPHARCLSCLLSLMPAVSHARCPSCVSHRALQG